MSEERDDGSKFDVALYKFSPKTAADKVDMMKVVMALTGWGLKQAKDFVDDPPGFVLERVSSEKAAEAVLALEKAGGEAGMQRVVELD